MEQAAHIEVPGAQAIDAVILRPRDATRCLVFAHGAGAGMRHRFMDAAAIALAERAVATVRFQFPYMQQGKRRPDSPRVLEAIIRHAVEFAHKELPDLPLFAGGKSMGGRMTSLAQAQEPLSAVRGLVYFGFPLHAPKKPDTKRAAHLSDISVPMLFLQGTRDTLADLELLGPIVDELDTAAMHVAEGADHSFSVLKRSGRTDQDVLTELADVSVAWMNKVASV